MHNWTGAGTQASRLAMLLATSAAWEPLRKSEACRLSSQRPSHKRTRRKWLATERLSLLYPKAPSLTHQYVSDIIYDWRQDNNERRLHATLNYLTPLASVVKLRNGESVNKDRHFSLMEVSNPWTDYADSTGSILLKQAFRITNWNTCIKAFKEIID